MRPAIGLWGEGNMGTTSTFRLALYASVAFAPMAAIGAAPAYAQSTPRQYDIPSQDLGTALRALSIQSGVDIVFDPTLTNGKTSSPVSGRRSVGDALHAMLRGTALSYKRTASGGFAIAGPLGAGEARPGEATVSSLAEGAGSAITVTGTRIRGAGSASPVTVTTRRQLEESGINDLADFTRIIPQNYTGGQNRGIAGGGEQGGQQNLNDSATLNLRGLGPDATLTLLNGHRLSYNALDQGVDISAIPVAAIERIEVVTDGASALYGSDAVGGVANIILRRDYEGLESTGRVGGATDGGDFQQEFSLVGGHRWDSGGFMIALDENSATPINAGQRDYTRTVDPSLTLTDRLHQFSGVVAAHQQIAPGLSLDLDGYAMKRRSLLQNPFLPTEDVHVIGLVSRNYVTSYALTPTLRAELGGWQASLSATDADSRTFLNARNYFNSVPRIARLLYEDRLKGAEATGEGPLFALPGGDARLAIGGGLRKISLHDRYVNVTGGQNVTVHDFTESRKVQFAYGELSLPLVGPDINFPLVDRLTLSAALRYEHWDKIASVTTPKLGLIYQPVSDVTLRATWGKSFKVPTLLQVNEVEGGYLIPGFYFNPAPQPAGAPVLLLLGSAPNLKPERATTWSGTFELRPRFIPGLDLQATYFHIDYRDRIADPLTSTLSALYNPLYSDFIIYNPSAEQVNALIATLPGGLINQTGAPFDASGIGAIIDASARNTERQRIHGVDLNGDYHLDLGQSGKLLLTAAASYLESSQQLAPGQPSLQLAGTIFRPPHWRGRAGAVWNNNRIGLSAFVNYVGPTIDNTYTDLKKIGSFVTLDVNASLRTAANTGALRNVELRLSAMNVLNQKPHLIRVVFPEEAPYDSTNESPVGRFIGVSIRKVW
jgi:outer membrane receptor protein involved in Fe transport